MLGIIFPEAEVLSQLSDFNLLEHRDQALSSVVVLHDWYLDDCLSPSPVQWEQDEPPHLLVM